MKTEISEKPILFSAPMVRAILDGRKTMTRRVVKCHCNAGHITGNLLGEWGLSVPPHQWNGDEDEIKWNWRGEKPQIGDWIEQFQTDVDDHDSTIVRCPYGKPGDRLWIKTGYTTRYDPERNETHWKTEGGWITTHGQAMSKTGKPKRDGGHPGMFMPKWLSQEFRLPLLEITDIRAERLQEITEEDAMAEGVTFDVTEEVQREDMVTPGRDPCAPVLIAPKDAFLSLWDSINKERGFGWGQNPWVWVIEFKRIN